jgi:hypothetical protein
VTSRALSILAAFASPLFLAAAIAGWVYGVWPATPATFTLACVIVAGGPLLGIWHVATADTQHAEDWIDADYVEEAPTRILTPLEPEPEPAPELVMTPKAAAARAFTNWRDKPNEAIAQRDRERRANAYAQT